MKISILCTSLTLSFFFFNTSANAQCIIPIELEQRVKQTEAVVLGTIMSQKSFWVDAEHYEMATAFKVELYQIFKGENIAKTIEIVTSGGQIGDTIHQLEPSPHLNIGETALLMCARLPKKILPNRADCYYLTCNVQSVVACDWDNRIAADLRGIYPDFTKSLFPKIEQWVGHSSVILKTYPLSIQRNKGLSLRSKPVVREISPKRFAVTEEGYFDVIGSGFGAKRGRGGLLGDALFFNILPYKYIDTASQNFISWSDTLVRISRRAFPEFERVAIVTDAGDTSNNDIRGQAAYRFLNQNLGTNTLFSRLVDANKKGGYSIYYGISCENDGVNFADSPAKGAFEAALNEWSAKTNINFRIGGTVTDKNPSDTLCIVRFDNNSRLLSSIGALGVCYSRAVKCDSNTFRLQSFEIIFLRNGSPIFNQAITWDYCTDVQPIRNGNNRYSFRAVALHELGHAIGLAHITEEKRIMYANGDGNATGLLYDDDIEAVNYIRQKSDLLTCFRPMNSNIQPPKVQSGCGEPLRIDFVGRFDPSVIVLNWRLPNLQTAQKVQIERSSDNRCFNILGVMDIKKPSDNLYLFTDRDLGNANGAFFYRLRFVEADGSYTFSPTITVSLVEKDKKVTAFPNPFQEGLSFKLDFLYADQLEAWFYDINGRLILQQKVSSTGTTVLEFDTKLLPAGLFIVELRSERGVILRTKVCKT